MEQFREHEKEFKTKEYSIKGLQKNRMLNDDNSYADNDYGTENYNLNDDGVDQENL